MRTRSGWARARAGASLRDGRIAEVTSFIGAEHVTLLGPPATAGS
ncbi:hypothetical protein [Pseudonocardia sp.]|nr:hypothetical protein [Pseudonocardia sp.]